ncbi:MAG TPA: tetratricopeptide repeat protein [Candidatus Cryosericum sp.]
MRKTKMMDHQLSALLDPLGENSDNWPRLRRQISTPLGIVPFVGEGLSVQLGFKSWSMFLLDQARKAGIEQTVQMNLEGGDQERASDVVLTALGHRAFLDAIDAEFGDSRLRNHRLAGSVTVLPLLARGPVITTNFDHVLERAFDMAGARFEHVVWGARATGAYQALTQDRHFLLKLLGDTEDHDDLVLTRADYDKYYSPGSPLSQILRLLFAARTVLFIGCSLGSDRWMRLLAQVVQANPTLEHFAIVEYPATASEYAQRRQFLSNHGITPIWFPHKRSDLIETILASLVPPSMLLVGRNRLVTSANDALLAHTTKFVGRTGEVTAVLQFLREATPLCTARPLPASKILLVTGAPGIGKSEVCREALQQFLRRRRSARVYYIELVDVREEAGLLARLADAFHVPQATSDKVYAAIAAQPSLLYLDNLENMLSDDDARAALATLVDLPGVRVLASSREHAAQFGRDLPILQLDPDAAVELFISEWNRSEFHSPQTDSPELHRFVCTDLDCHALSIVLVAAQAYQTASLHELIQRWRNDATRLARLPHGKDRPTSLAVSFERSLAVVQSESADAVTLWGLCALFPEGMSAAAFDAVTKAFADHGFRERQILLRLSIIHLSQPHSPGKGTGESRTSEMTVSMTAPLRRFILEKALEEAVGLNIDNLLSPVVAYFSGLAAIAQQTELGHDRTAHGIALDRLLPELPNLYEAVVWAGQRGTRWAEPLGTLSRVLSNSYRYRPLLSIDILHALLPIQQRAHRDVDVGHTLQHLGRMEDRLGETEAARQDYTDAMRLFRQQREDYLLANTLRGLGDLEIRLGETEAARQHYTEAMKLYTQERENLEIANVLTRFGRLEDRLGEIGHARQHYTEAIDLFTKERGNLGLANALKSLGDLEKRLGEIDQARQHYTEAKKLYTRERDNLGLANALSSLGDLEKRLGEIDQARQHYTEAMMLFAREHTNVGLANALRGLGDLEKRLGEIDQARQHYTEAIDLFTKEQNDLGLANTLRGLSDLESRLGEIDQARQHYTEAIDLFTKQRDDLGLANTLRGLSDLESRLGEIDQARQHYTEATKLYTRERDNLGLANTLSSLGDLEKRLGEIDHARQHYTEAIDLFTKERDNLGLANALRGLGDLEKRLGEIDHARQHYTKAMKLFTQEGNNLGLANALQSVGDLNLTLKKFQQAGVHYAKARELYTTEREMMGLGYTDTELARVAHALNHPAEADRYLDEGMLAAQASNVPSVAQYVAQARTEIHPDSVRHNGGSDA